ncbi:MAG: hypothetical protein RLZZ102_774, partial [Pseudomonadota bacterium]
VVTITTKNPRTIKSAGIIILNPRYNIKKQQYHQWQLMQK